MLGWLRRGVCGNNGLRQGRGAGWTEAGPVPWASVSDAAIRSGVAGRRVTNVVFVESRHPRWTA